VNMCLETGGTAVGNHPALVVVVQDDICKQILQNSQTDDCSILTLILRIVFDLFATLRRHIRVQLEVKF
jgi:golgi-specific brefeldin A-resistance guanine nucleotide exchange factor 1